MAKYIYPKDLSDNAYKNRKVTITAKRPKEDADAQSMYNSAITKLSDFSDSIAVKSDTVKDIITALKNNKKTSGDATYDTIVLPLPNSLTDSQSHNWSEESGLIGSAGKTLFDTSVGDVASKVLGKNALGKFVSSVTPSGYSIDKGLGEMSSSTGLRKPIFDPGYFQNYSGSGLRDFNMDWDLIPSNPEEAETILMIVMKLKQYSSPSKVKGGVALLAPHYFDVTISNDYITSMIKLDRVVIKNISLDYGADGFMQQTADGMPKFMKLSLSFAATDITTAQDYSTKPSKPHTVK